MKKVLKYLSFVVTSIVIVLGFHGSANASTCDSYTYPCKELQDGSVIVATGSGERDNYVPGVSSTNTKSSSTSYLKDYNLLIRKYKGSGDVEDGSSYEWLSNIKLYHHSGSRGGILYCLDSDALGLNSLYARRFLSTELGADGKPTEGNAYDTAILSVLINGERSSKTSDKYLSTSIAIRCLTALWGYTKVGKSDLFETYLGQAYAWINGYAENKSSYDILSKNVGLNRLSVLKQYEKFTFQPLWHSDTNSADTRAVAIINEARELFTQALADAADYATSANQPSIEYTTTPGIPEKEETTVGKYVTSQTTYNFTLKNFTNDGKAFFTISSLAYNEDLKTLGVNTQPSIVSIKVNGKSYTDIYNFKPGDNILQILSPSEITNEIKIEVVIEFGGFESVEEAYQNLYETLNCGQQPMNYTLKYLYKDTNLSAKFSNYVGVVWDATKKSAQSNNNYQRFVEVYELGNDNKEEEVEGKIEGTIQLIDACDCDDLIEACIETDNWYSDECQAVLDEECGECAELKISCEVLDDDEACKQYNATCDVTCDTQVDNFDCCNAQGELIISAIDNHEVDIVGPEDVKACFVDQIDGQVDKNGDKGASDVEGAKDDVENKYTLQQNKYCVVSCKEDYAMTMPNAKLVNAGRYFTFRASISGTKTCYTNTIDRELYNEDIIEIQERIYQAYNEYIRYQTALESNPHNLTSVTACTNKDAYCKGCTCTENTTYIPGSTTDDFRYTAYYPTFNENTGQIVSLNPTTEYGPESAKTPISSGSDTASGCTCYKSDGKGGTESYTCSHSCSYTIVGEERDETWLVNHLTELRDKYEELLDDAISDYNETIKMYNDCSNWETEIEYDSKNPEVFYDYEEDYLADMYHNYGEMDASINDKNTEEWYCNGISTSSRYLYGEVNNSYNRCDNSTSYKESALKYVMCDKNSRKCWAETENISDATYKKVTSTVDADYMPSTLFYNVYPSGEIVDADEGEDRDDTVALENSLPVSLSTPRGIYKYTININGLGEYYDRNGDLGRLIGGDNAVINADDYANYVDSEGNVQYACSYLVNMGKEIDGMDLICDYDTECTGDDCFADCVGPNCDKPPCEGDNCIADCIGAGCIYDSDAGSSIFEKVVSLNNLFPNGTNSYNWNRDKNEKAEVTIDEIQDKDTGGNKIYDQDPILSITITRDVAMAIKEYNDEAEKEYNNGYLNSTLSCYDMSGYEEIACYSSFISGLLEGMITYDGKTLGSDLEIVNNRSLIMADGYRTESDDNNKYFTIWEKEVSEDLMIGPSWK